MVPGVAGRRADSPEAWRAVGGDWGVTFVTTGIHRVGGTHGPPPCAPAPSPGGHTAGIMTHKKFTVGRRPRAGRPQVAGSVLSVNQPFIAWPAHIAPLCAPSAHRRASTPPHHSANKSPPHRRPITASPRYSRLNCHLIKGAWSLHTPSKGIHPVKYIDPTPTTHISNE